MQRHLYFICPTDNLESVINKAFRQENYYITSLGNSILFDDKTVAEINKLLDSKDIKRVSFVLSQNNRVVLEAMEMKSAESNGLNDFQNKIKRQKNYAHGIWNGNDHQFLTLSYHLNDKIKELRSALSCLRIDPPNINAIIYDRSGDTFKSIYSDLIHENSVSVN